MEIMGFLVSKGVKAVIIACGTVSSNSYDDLRAAFDLPLFEMVSNGVAACLAVVKNGKAGIIATEATIASGRYERLLREADPTLEVFAKACPLFVPLAEEGWTDNAVAEITANTYLSEFRENRVDAVILGCTHYPLLYNQIQKAVGGAVLVNPAEEAAKAVRRYLRKNKLARTDPSPPEHRFYISDDTEKFNRLSQRVLFREFAAELIRL
jgi:glutamate racemase